MKTKRVQYKNNKGRFTLDITLHYIDGEVSEIYVSWEGSEILSGHSISEVETKIIAFFN